MAPPRLARHPVLRGGVRHRGRARHRDPGVLELTLGAVIRLDCPFCRHVIVDGTEPPDEGVCEGCGARFSGGGDSAPDGVERALARWGRPEVDPKRLARQAFEWDPADPATPVAVVSDHRDTFYKWWMFVRRESEIPEV